MVEPEVKSIVWVDDFPWDNGDPETILVSATIGVMGEPGGDLFHVTVCNPAWISAQTKSASGMWPRGFLIVDSFCLKHIESNIQALADNFKRSSDWSVFAERMNRYLLWEYEDYNDYQGEPPIRYPD